MNDFRDWLQFELERIGASQRQLAGFMRIRPAAITEIFNGTRQLSADEAKKIAKYLDCEVGKVIGAYSEDPLISTSITNRGESPDSAKKVRKLPYNPLYDPAIAIQAVKETNQYIDAHRLRVYFNDATVVIWRVYRLLEQGEKVSNTLMEMFFEDIDTTDNS